MQLPTLSRNIVISLLLAALAAVALFLYASSVRHQAETSQTTMRVVVATRDLPAGTSVDSASADGGLAYRAVRKSDAAPSAITQLHSAAGQVLTSEVYRGDQLTAQRIGSANKQGLAYRISGVQRAMRVTFRADSGLLADLEDGDKVDVFATYKLESGQTVTYLLARAALVLAVDNSQVLSSSASSDAGTVGTGTATLSVPEQQAANIANALQGGADTTFPLYLALAPKNHPAQQTIPPAAMPNIHEQQ